jgi:hypothetical protein
LTKRLTVSSLIIRCSRGAWGLPLIVLTVLIHVSGLLVISQRVVHSNVERMTEGRHPKVAFVVILDATTLLATCLHGIEACIWACAYLFLGALPDFRSPVLYSLNAMTSCGHTNLNLEDHWHLMGAMEALNGWLLFGLTTAFLFAVIDKIRLTGRGSVLR